MKQFIIVIFSVLMMAGLVSFTTSSENNTVKKGEAFRSVSLINLKAETDEADFLKMSSEYNAAFVELGYPDCKYQVWKERGDRKGKYKYILEGLWPNQETYDKIHESAKYKEISKKYDARWKEMVQEHVYSRYVQMK